MRERLVFYFSVAMVFVSWLLGRSCAFREVQEIPVMCYIFRRLGAQATFVLAASCAKLTHLHRSVISAFLS